jgi:hypothetical protein
MVYNQMWLQMGIPENGLSFLYKIQYTKRTSMSQAQDHWTPFWGGNIQRRTNFLFHFPNCPPRCKSTRQISDMSSKSASSTNSRCWGVGIKLYWLAVDLFRWAEKNWLNDIFRYRAEAWSQVSYYLYFIAVLEWMGEIGAVLNECIPASQVAAMWICLTCRTFRNWQIPLSKWCCLILFDNVWSCLSKGAILPDSFSMHSETRIRAAQASKFLTHKD